MKVLKVIVFALLGLVALFVLAGAAAVFWLGTEPGRGWLAATIEEAASGPGQRVEIGSTQGSPFGTLVVRDVAVADDEGVWLAVDEARLAWEPLALLRRRLQVDAIEVGSLDLRRLPSGPEDETEEGGPPGLPDLPVTVALDRLAVERLHLGKAVLGTEDAAVQVAGSALLGEAGRSLSVKLGVDRIDGRAGSVALDVLLVPDEDRLDLALSVAEPEGGIIARLAGLPGQPPVTASLDGTGTLADWQGRLEAAAGPGLALAADLSVERAGELDGEQGGHRVAVSASGTVDALLASLPDDVRAAVGDRPRLDLLVVVPGSGPLGIERAEVELAALTASASGSYAAGNAALDLAYAVDVRPEPALQRLAGDASWRSLSLEGTLTGPVDAPQVTATLRAEQPAVAGFAAREAVATVRADPVDEPAGSAAFAVRTDGEVAGLALPDPALAQALGETLTWEGSAVVAPEAGTLRLERLIAGTASGDLSVSGTAALSGESADLRVVLDVPALAAFAPLLGVPLEGGAGLTAEVALAGGAVEATLAGAARDLVTGIPPADALLGGAVDLAATVGVSPGGDVAVEGLRLSADRLGVTGQATLAGGDLAASWRAEAGDLAALGDAVGQPLSGGLVVEGSATGSPEAPVVSVRAAGRDLVVAGTALGAPVLDLDVRDLAAGPRGRAELTAVVEGLPLQLATTYALRDGTLALDGLELAAGSARAAGDLAVDLATATVAGRLDGQVPDLAPFAALAGTDLRGSTGFEVRLTAPQGRQSVGIVAGVDGLRVLDGGEPSFLAGRLDLRAEVADLLGTPAGSVEVEGTDALAGGASLAVFGAEAEGSLERADFRASAEGGAGQPFQIETAGTFAAGGEASRVALDRFRGIYGDEPFELAQPAALVFGDGIAVEDLRLRSGAAALAADARIGADALEGQIRLDRIPLDLARLFDPTLGLDGTLDGTAVLSGSPADPRAEVEVRLSGAGAAAVRDAGVEGVDARATALWRGGELAVEGTATTEREGVDLSFSATVPLVMDPVTLVPAVPDPAPLRAGVQGRVDLARFDDLLAATGDRVEGTLDVDLSVTGTLGEPQVGGTAVLAGGRYENQATGAVVTDLTARLVGEGTRLVLSEFSGRTPGGGNLRAKGTIDLDPAAARQISVEVVANDARLLRTDLATASVSADLLLSGTFERSDLAGKIRIRRAEIRVPDRLPPGIVELDVVEVNGERPTVRVDGRPPIPRRKPGGPNAAVAGTGGVAPAPAAAEPGMVVGLDVVVSAENQVFVRGRGLDAELGGELLLDGTVSNPRITGDLEMIQGELDLLAQRFEFTRGNISFVGDGQLIPRLDLAAETSAGDVKAIVAVTGPVTEPNIELSSQPALPQDEVLSRILFGRATGQLTAFQAVQLAQSAAQLAGYGGGPGILDRVRRSIGVDRLEITSGEEGGGPTGFGAGRYLSEDVYVGVEQDVREGGTRAKVELDVTDNVQVEADVGGRKGGRVGLRFEWEY
ncbi:translocation/assembly module TamB domain-containing protein [Arenibaculum sp.]|uniref:translocation/assembly module TamB domain-containing protein n=1 Tax=Arenibaculum sp. TaxID=2865862 RepID=UPI002E0D4F84|nr:translocation/assembly module TamB domain-containing protein [Arenibaculum sp.]